MKSKSLKVCCLHLVVFVVFSLGSAFAQPPITKQPIRPIPMPKPPIPNPNVLKPQADLEIYGIGNKHWEGRECSACYDTLSRVGAFYLHDLTVGVMCNSDRVRKTNGTVTVTYYDLVQGRSVTVGKHFVNLSCKGQPRHILVTVVNHPLLIKRSVEIRATVKPDAPVEDPNPGNNRMTVRLPGPYTTCLNPIVY